MARVVCRSFQRCAIAWITIFAFAISGFGQTTVGSIKTVTGQVTVARSGQLIDVKEGFLLLVQDSLRTAAEARVGIILKDGTRFSLGPNSELVLEKFVFEPAEGQLGMLVRLVKGIAAYISGQIAQLAPNSSQIETPVGVIGLRGTHVAISLEPQ
ncbi:MAG: FecR domain-containing protein [Bryobacterales bacterium]|nr:FecR domain-containing protein [Bryobacterales bacterium]